MTKDGNEMQPHPAASKALLAQSLQKQLQDNQQDIYVLDLPDLIRLFRTDKKRHANWSDDRINAWLKGATGDAVGALQIASNYASAANDSTVLAILAKEMIRSGSILNRYREVVQNGRVYIVFKGNPRLRTVLTAARYSAKNPKILAMAVGTAALKAGAKSGFLIGMAFSVAFDVASWMKDDQQTIPDLVSGISIDLLSNALSTTAGLSASLLVAEAVSIAVLPLAAGIAVALIAGWGLSALIRHTDLKNRLAIAISKCLSDMESHARQTANNAYINAQGLAAQQQFISLNWGL